MWLQYMVRLDMCVDKVTHPELDWRRLGYFVVRIDFGRETSLDTRHAASVFFVCELKSA